MASAVSAHMRAITGIRATSGGPYRNYLSFSLRGLRAYFVSIQEGEKIDPQILVVMMDLFRTEFFARRIGAGRFHAWICDALIDRVCAEQRQQPSFHQSWNLCAVIQALYNHAPRLRTMGLEPTPSEQMQVPGFDRPQSSTRTGLGFDAVAHFFNSDMRAFIQEII